MKERFRGLSIILLLSGLVFFSSPQPVFGNPYFVPDLSVGGLWNNNTFIEMPLADVHIQINYLGDATFEIAMIGNFTIWTNTTQDYSLAFAYPESWTEGFIFYSEQLFNISLDGNPVTTWPLYFENPSWITLWRERVLYHMSCYPDYVGFNLSLQADVNHSLVVRSSFTKMTNLLDLGYVCGTALSFRGPTQEKITFEVNQSKSFSRSSFYPNTNFSLVNETLYKRAVWDLFYPYPLPYDGNYYPVDMVNAYLYCFEDFTPTTVIETTPVTTYSSTTTSTSTPTTTWLHGPEENLGAIVFSGIVGFTMTIVLFVIWKSKKY
ncbi:MAG: hypothetical protein ACXAAO_10485 [Candidatus Thorarchaeota archaeon]